MAWPVRYRLGGLLASGSMINDDFRGDEWGGQFCRYLRADERRLSDGGNRRLVAAVCGHCRGVVERGPGIVFSGCSGTD